MSIPPTSNEKSVIVRAGEAFVAKFKREPVSASDCAWINGYVAASGETTREPLVDWKASHELAVEQRGRLARYILTNLSGDWRIKDHACAQCAPESEIITNGFVCAYHLASGIVNGFPSKTGADPHGS